MKKKLVSVVTILIILSSLLLYLRTVPDKEVYFYKTARFCSKIAQKMMKDPNSFNEIKSSLMYQKSSEDKLRERMKGKEYLEKYFKNQTLSSYQLISFIKYQSKNSFNANITNTATCYFDSFFIENEGFMNAIFEKMIISNNLYKNDMISTDDFLSMLKIDDIGLFDKLDYLINKNSFHYYEN